MNRRTKTKPATMDTILTHVAALGGTVRSRADALGINYVRLHRLESGRNREAFAMLDQIAEALGLTITVTKGENPA